MKLIFSIYKPTRISSLTKVKMKGYCHTWISREVAFYNALAIFQGEGKFVLQNTAQIFNFTPSFAGYVFDGYSTVNLLCINVGMILGN